MDKNQIIKRLEEQFKSDIFLKRKDGIADKFIETKLEYILDFLRANLPSTVSQRRTLDKEQIIEKFGKEFQTFNNDYQEVWKKDVLPRDIVDWLSQNLPSITDGECKQCDEFDKKLAEQQRINNEVLADKCDEMDKIAKRFHVTEGLCSCCGKIGVDEGEILQVIKDFPISFDDAEDMIKFDELELARILSATFSQPKENLLPIIKEQEKFLAKLKQKNDELFEENRYLEKDKRDLMANLDSQPVVDDDPNPYKRYEQRRK